jgi:hypothetical protein
MILVAAAILVGVFVAATGRGGELACEPADHAPLDMGPVSASDVVMLRPPTALWGYNMQVTDEALARIAQAVRDRDVTIAYLQQRLADSDPARTAPDRIAPDSTDLDSTDLDRTAPDSTDLDRITPDNIAPDGTALDPTAVDPILPDPTAPDPAGPPARADQPSPAAAEQPGEIWPEERPGE